MKKLINLFFALVMMFSIVFIGEAISSNGNLTVQAQQKVTVKRKKRKGLIRKGYAGGKWAGRKSWQGGKYVGRKAWKGTKWTGKKTWKGTKWTGRKVKRVVY
jgi:hypothetical protein